MRIDYLNITSAFKNLEGFKIDLHELAMETVLLGLNASGKSNFIEALVIIFRDLDLERDPHSTENSKLGYILRYECNRNNIEISFDPTPHKGYSFAVNGKKKSKKLFFQDKHEYLPRHVFVYYSGINNRMKELFDPHRLRHFRNITSEKAELNVYEQFNRIQPIFLVDEIHGSIALISLFMFPEREQETLNFLNKELNIKDFASALFILKQPDWAKNKKDPDRFWDAKGLVRRVLEDLWNFSLAPIRFRETVSSSYKKKETQDRLYLYIKDKATFQDFVSFKYENKTELFNGLNSLDVSDFVHDIKVNVIKEEDGELAMKELSEGEKQLLTVLGMLKFTKDEESLILLDEPDTHLNPSWKWSYLDYIDQVVKRPETTQVIFCTHDPLVIGNLEKEQVRIFRRNEENKIVAEEPNVSPKGLGVSGILTSELFGLKTTLDKATQDKLEERNKLLYKKSIQQLSQLELEQLENLFEQLNQLGFTQTFKDPLYSEFIVAYEEHLMNQKEGLSQQVKEEGKSTAYNILMKLLKKKP